MKYHGLKIDSECPKRENDGNLTTKNDSCKNLQGWVSRPNRLQDLTKLPMYLFKSSRFVLLIVFVLTALAFPSDHGLQVVAASATAPKEKPRVIPVLWMAKGAPNSCATTRLNTAYLKQLAPLEKAALTYISTLLASECEDVATQKGLVCSLTAGLGFKFQCAPEQMQLIKTWFAGDTAITDHISESYDNTPPGATVQRSFSSINLVRSAGSIEINYTASGLSMRGRSWDWEEKLLFGISRDRKHLTLKKRTGRRLREEKLFDNDSL